MRAKQKKKKKIEGVSGDYGVKMTPGKVRTLCDLEWPTFGVVWSLEGTLEVSMVHHLWCVVNRDPDHPDQFLYIDSWLEIAQTLPSLCDIPATNKDRLGS